MALYNFKWLCISLQGFIALYVIYISLHCLWSKLHCTTLAPAIILPRLQYLFAGHMLPFSRPRFAIMRCLCGSHAPLAGLLRPLCSPGVALSRPSCCPNAALMRPSASLLRPSCPTLPTTHPFPTFTRFLSPSINLLATFIRVFYRYSACSRRRM